MQAAKGIFAVPVGPSGPSKKRIPQASSAISRRQSRGSLLNMLVALGEVSGASTLIMSPEGIGPARTEAASAKPPRRESKRIDKFEVRMGVVPCQCSVVGFCRCGERRSTRRGVQVGAGRSSPRKQPHSLDLEAKQSRCEKVRMLRETTFHRRDIPNVK